MNFSGQWWNPAYSGEGITIQEYPDGKVIAHFFSYSPDGRQLWLIGVGERIDDQAILKAWSTSGGVLGDPQALPAVTEHEWGEIGLSENSGVLTLSVRPDSEPDFGYPLQPLYTPQPAPIPNPNLPIIRITRTKPGIVAEMTVPLIDRMAKPESHEHVITVETKSLTITNLDCSGPYHPAIIGLTKGQVLQPGRYPVRYKIDPDYPWVQGSYVWTRFNVRTLELKTILTLDVQVQRPAT